MKNSPFAMIHASIKSKLSLTKWGNLIKERYKSKVTD